LKNAEMDDNEWMTNKNTANKQANDNQTKCKRRKQECEQARNWARKVM